MDGVEREFETLREDVDFVLLRSRPRPDHSSVLRLEAVSDALGVRSLERLEHEYALRDQLDRTWAARPRALAREHGRPTLLLDDPGGEILARLMGRPWELGAFLRVAAGIAATLGQLHQRGLIHKDVKP